MSVVQENCSHNLYNRLASESKILVLFKTGEEEFGSSSY